MHIKKLIWRWLPVLAWCSLIFYLSSVPHLAINDGLSDLLLRKTAHMVEYATLFLLIYRAVIGWKQWSLRWVIVTLLLAVAYASSDEWHQRFVSGRHGAAFDVLIDGLGMVIGIAGLAWWVWWQRSLDTAAEASKEVHETA